MVVFLAFRLIWLMLIWYVKLLAEPASALVIRPCEERDSVSDGGADPTTTIPGLHCEDYRIQLDPHLAADLIKGLPTLNK